MSAAQTSATAGDLPAVLAAGAPSDALPFTDDRLAAAYFYWRRKRESRPMPRRADIDPIEIPRLLPDVMLVDVLGDGRYRYRLIGTENARAHGMNATGRYLDEVLPGVEYRTHVTGLYDKCVKERRPVYTECLFLSQLQAPERHTKVVFLPLSDDGETVNIVFVVQIFLYVAQITSRDRHFIDARPYREITHVLL